MTDWRRSRIGRISKIFQCELCRYQYRVSTTYPAFYHYMWHHWTFFEKLLYFMSSLSTFFSFRLSMEHYTRDLKKKKTKLTFLSKLFSIPEIFLYGWPPRFKFLMFMCMLIVVSGNYFTFQIWKERNKLEYVHPYSTEKVVSKEETPLSK